MGSVADAHPDGVEHGVAQGRRRRDVGRLTDAHHPAVVAGVGQVEGHRHDLRHLHRAGDLVHHQIRVHLHAVAGVQEAVLVQGVAEALDGPAQQLALEQQLVDHPPGVLDADDLDRLDVAGLGVDLDLGELHAVHLLHVGLVVVLALLLDLDLRPLSLISLQASAKASDWPCPITRPSSMRSSLAGTFSLAAASSSSFSLAAYTARRVTGPSVGAVVDPPEAGPLGHLVWPSETLICLRLEAHLLGGDHRQQRARAGADVLGAVARLDRAVAVDGAVDDARLAAHVPSTSTRPCRCPA